MRRPARTAEQAKRLYEYGCVTEMDIVRLIYRPVEPQGASKTYDFRLSGNIKSHRCLQAHLATGLDRLQLMR
jgi:Patatin phospholipase